MIFDFIFRRRINETKELNLLFNYLAKTEANRLKKEFKKQWEDIDISWIWNNEFSRYDTFSMFSDRMALEFLNNRLEND